ncbi:MAG: hypothetical protein OXT67_11035 [Zetaproteobacteria bacterium]|nr:hypothetical protein [Zetaproteobacteria bacterium]
METYPTFVAVLGCVLSLALAYVVALRRRLQAGKSALENVLQRERKAVSERERSVQNLAAVKAEKSSLGGALAKLEKENKSMRETMSALESTSTREREELTGAVEQMRDQVESLREQNASMLSQLKSLDMERAELTRKLERKGVLADQATVLKSQLQSLDQTKAELAQAKKKLQTQQQLRQSLEKVFERRLVQEIQRFKDKIGRARHVNMLMASRRALVEDQSRNWETALRLLSNWVLDHFEQTTLLRQPEVTLGALVTRALEVTQSPSLVEDEYAFKEPVQHQDRFLDDVGEDAADLMEDKQGQALAVAAMQSNHEDLDATRKI